MQAFQVMYHNLVKVIMFMIPDLLS